MMVASLDPVGHTVSMVSIPRDLVNVPLGGGDVYGPKLNSLMSYADVTTRTLPAGRHRRARGRRRNIAGDPDPLLRADRLRGFIHMVDAVGGVDIDVAEGFSDPGYDGFGLDGRGSR